MASASQGGSFKGTVYGDLIGAPYMIENTHNRYFELGESRRAFSNGRVRSFFPEVTEVSHGATAVCNWLTTYRNEPTVEHLQKCLRNQFFSHPRGGWTEPTRLILTSGKESPSSTPDWSAVTRGLPIATFLGDNLFRALELTEACVRATCADEDTVRVAQALTHAVFLGRHGCIAAEVFTTLEMQYGLKMTRPDEEFRAELQGQVEVPLEMLGKPVPGAFRYITPESPAPPSARVVAEAAMRAVVQSDSWEDAVRRAVALGGPSNAVAGIAGGVAEALYGEVSPTIVGKLFPYIPTDIVRQIEQDELSRSVRVDTSVNPYSHINRDSLSVISHTGRENTYVVPKERRDILAVIMRTAPGARIIEPSAVSDYLSGFRDSRTGTFAYGPRPEVRTLYVQDGKRLVSPSRYVAAGMPTLQERKRHMEAFVSFREWSIRLQEELNMKAGNPGAGQIHYGDAYHLWIGQRKIDFLMGDTLAGRISLNERGLLKVELGDYRDLSPDARFENHREQAWASRSLFSVGQTVNPTAHLEDIREAIRSRLLDEGLGSGIEREYDARYLSDEELRDRAPVSNIDHLDRLDPGEPRGVPPKGTETGELTLTEAPVEGKSQGCRTVYSIGYGLRSQEGFINTLQMLGIDTVIDVRRIPKSRFAPQFNEDVIYEALQDKGIAYFSAGEKLGARSTDRALLNEAGQIDWEKARQETSFKEGIAAIKEHAEGGQLIAVVCTEGDPLVCHRLGTVSRSLAAEGMDVRHVLTNGEVVSHTEMEDRLLQKYIRKNMIPSVESGTYSAQLEEAYKALNREHGYRPRLAPSKGRKYVKVKL